MCFKSTKDQNLFFQKRRKKKKKRKKEEKEKKKTKILTCASVLRTRLMLARLHNRYRLQM